MCILFNWSKLNVLKHFLILNFSEGEETPAVEDPADKEMTLDEWKAQQSNTRTKAAFNIRKPNEGADSSQWKKMTMLKKKPQNDSDEEEESDEDDEASNKTV